MLCLESGSDFLDVLFTFTAFLLVFGIALGFWPVCQRTLGRSIAVERRLFSIRAEPILIRQGKCSMIEPIDEKIDRFYDYFERQATSVGSLTETRGFDLFGRIILTSMLDTFSKVSENDPDDQILSGKRFTTFIKTHSGWNAATRVSLLHLARALEVKRSSEFSSLCTWVAAALSKALDIENPGSIVQHPMVVEPPITVDPTLEETQKHWPKEEDGRPIRLKVGTISGQGLRPCHFTHAELLWRYRCHLVHEFRVPGQGWDVKKTGEPYYQNLAAVESILDWRVTTRCWELVYPLGFLQQLCVTSLLNLRQQLRCESRNPYQAFKFGSYWLSELN